MRNSLQQTHQGIRKRSIKLDCFIVSHYTYDELMLYLFDSPVIPYQNEESLVAIISERAFLPSCFSNTYYPGVDLLSKLW